MRFHLPKPLHGWRAFIGEVGIIVLGVLIALGAGQIVDTIHQRSELAQLRAALHAELADDRARWENIRAGDACTLRRLDALEHWLAVAPADARVKHAYMPFLWNTHTSAWDSAKSTPAGQLLGLDERLTYASLYEGLDNWRRINDNEIEIISTLIPKRQALIKRPDLAKVVNLEVDEKSYWLYTSDPNESFKREQAFRDHGFEKGLEILSRSGGTDWEPLLTRGADPNGVLVISNKQPP